MVASNGIREGPWWSISALSINFRLTVKWPSVPRMIKNIKAKGQRLLNEMAVSLACFEDPNDGVCVYRSWHVHSKVRVAQASVQHLCRDSPGVDFFLLRPTWLDLGWASVLLASVNTSNNGSDRVRNMVNHVMEMYIYIYKKKKRLAALSWPEIYPMAH